VILLRGLLPSEHVYDGFKSLQSFFSNAKQYHG
jgi:hypothetical protein